jgi:hypothetical protein
MKKRFTVIEVLIIVSIICILTAIFLHFGTRDRVENLQEIVTKESLGIIQDVTLFPGNFFRNTSIQVKTDKIVCVVAGSPVIPLQKEAYKFTARNNLTFFTWEGAEEEERYYIWK